MYENGVLTVTKGQLDQIFDEKAENLKNMATELRRHKYPVISNIDEWAHQVISKAEQDQSGNTIYMVIDNTGFP